MKEFFVKFFVKGYKVILSFVAIWVIYFILNFIDPTLFNFLRTNHSNPAATSTASTSSSLGYKIYNVFFKSRSTSPKNTSTTTKSTSKDFWNSSSTVVWGGDSATVWGGTQFGSQNALEGQTFVSPNTQKSPVIGMKINTLSVNANNYNYLPGGAMIIGSIYTGFLNSYYFNAEIYDANGSFIFSIPMTSSHDLNTESFSNFYGQYNKSINAINYKGKGYMVIKSDNQNVSGSVLIKIELK